MDARAATAEIDFRLANNLNAEDIRPVLQPAERSDALRATPAVSDGPVADGGSDAVTASGDQMIDGLLYDLKWDITDLDYSFPTSGAQ